MTIEDKIIPEWALTSANRIERPVSLGGRIPLDLNTNLNPTVGAARVQVRVDYKHGQNIGIL